MVSPLICAALLLHAASSRYSMTAEDLSGVVSDDANISGVALPGTDSELIENHAANSPVAAGETGTDSELIENLAANSPVGAGEKTGTDSDLFKNLAAHVDQNSSLGACVNSSFLEKFASSFHSNGGISRKLTHHPSEAAACSTCVSLCACACSSGTCGDSSGKFCWGCQVGMPSGFSMCTSQPFSASPAAGSLVAERDHDVLKSTPTVDAAKPEGDTVASNPKKSAAYAAQRRLDRNAHRQKQKQRHRHHHHRRERDTAAGALPQSSSAAALEFRAATRSGAEGGSEKVQGVADSATGLFPEPGPKLYKLIAIIVACAIGCVCCVFFTQKYARQIVGAIETFCYWLVRAIVFPLQLLFTGLKLTVYPVKECAINTYKSVDTYYNPWKQQL